MTESQREAILEFAKDEDFKGTVNEAHKGFFKNLKEKILRD